jgi:hypothetical protein
MRGSAESAASSARLAVSILRAVSSCRHVRRIQLQVARELAQLFGLGQAGVRVLGGDIGQLDGRFHQVRDALGDRSEV